MSLLNDLNRLTACNIHDPTKGEPSSAQVAHRIALVEAWGVDLAGATIFECGCGQGDMTSVIAAAVGVGGTVIGCDPAPLDYGAPWTLGQAQEWLSRSEVGSRISWLQADPCAYLREHAEVVFDYAVLAHSLYYFASPSELLETISLLAGRAKKGVLLAEWALQSSSPSSLPHLLATLTQATLETKSPKEELSSNVRTVLSPTRMRGLIAESGLTIANDSIITPKSILQDGGWEASRVTSSGWESRARSLLGAEGERELASVLALRDATNSAVEQLSGQSVTSMDVWCARVVI